MACGAKRRCAFGVDLRNGAVERVTRDHVSPTGDRPDVPALVAGGTKDESAIVDLREDVIRRTRDARVDRAQPCDVAGRANVMVDRQHVERRVVVDVEPVVFDMLIERVVVFRDLAVRVL